MSPIIVGVDTVSIAVRVTDSSDEVRHSASGITIGGCGRLRVRNCEAQLQVSLPKFRWGHNAIALPITDLHQEIDKVIDALSDHVVIETSDRDCRSVKVKRLDLVRDFDDVPCVSDLIEGLRKIPRPGRMFLRTFSNRAGHSETLTVGPKSSWAATLYDKYAECPDFAKPGQLRCELRCRKRLQQKWAVHHGGKINVLADINPQKAARIARGMFDDARFGVQIMTHASMAAEVMAYQELSETQKLRLIGYLTVTGAGLHVATSPTTLNRYQRYLEAVGFPAEHTARNLRLDWTNGLQVMNP